jgi:psp operon transcriptional activator
MAAELGWQRFPGFSRAAHAEIEAHDWPGNVRELKNVIERSLYRWDNEAAPVGEIVIDPFESPWRLTADPAPNETESPGAAPLASPTADFRAAVMAYEHGLLVAGLGNHRHNQRRTAKALGLSYDQLRHAMKRHGLLETETSK